MVKKFIGAERGEGYIDVAVFMLAIMLAFAFFLDLLPIFITKYNLDMFASEVVRAAEMTGSTTSGAVSLTISNMRENTGISPAIIWERGGPKVQLGSEITLRLETTETLSLFGVGHFPVPLRARASGMSEVYYK
ncbi:MAG: DUF4320 family protein [Lachnospiraceae bacterium]|nr:DUF4320 family protein [Lachnospiraceae bacterium]